MSDKFVKLTSSEDNTTVTINTRYIVKAVRGEDDEVTTVVMSDEYSDVEVDETPGKVYTLINKPYTPPGTPPAEIDGDPIHVLGKFNPDSIGEFKDDHMQRLSNQA